MCWAGVPRAMALAAPESAAWTPACRAVMLVLRHHAALARMSPGLRSIMGEAPVAPRAARVAAPGRLAGLLPHRRLGCRPAA